MKVSQLRYEDLTQNAVDRILFEGLEDDLQNGDCILVLGSTKASKIRVPKAVELYHAGRSKKILMSGGDIQTPDGMLFTSSDMRNKAIELGIPPEDILEENESQTTKENMICSLLILEREFKLCTLRRILLVTSRFHMRRSMMMARTYMPNWIEFTPCCADDSNTRRDNWYLSEKGIKRATDEAYKIACYIREGSIPDFEI